MGQRVPAEAQIEGVCIINRRLYRVRCVTLEAYTHKHIVVLSTSQSYLTCVLFKLLFFTLTASVRSAILRAFFADILSSVESRGPCVCVFASVCGH